MATAIEHDAGISFYVDRGSRPDFAFGTAASWGALEVVRWHSVEEISRPFSYEITLLARSLGVASPAAAPRAEVDEGGMTLSAPTERSWPAVHELLDAPASFALAHQAGRRVVHGILAAAEEIDRTSSFSLLRVSLEPHIVRMRERKPCRTFRKRSFRDVIARLLENRPVGASGGSAGLTPATPSAGRLARLDTHAYVDPVAGYRWALFEPESGRFADIDYRSTITQINESDFDLFSRLLEEEGLSYYFEHAETASTLVITDRPASAPIYGEPLGLTLRAGAHSLDDQTERIATFRHRHELRPLAARITEHDRMVPRMLLEGQTVGSFHLATGVHTLFAGPGGPGFEAHFSRVHMERFDAHRSLCSGAGNVRTLEPGARVALRDADGLREDRDLVIVRVEAFGQQRMPKGTVLDQEGFGFRDEPHFEHHYESRFHALDATRNFRPELRHPNPRMNGIHRAMVTAEEGGVQNPEINANPNGDIRIRFPWDERPPERGIASSRWTPVVDFWGGTGWGSHHTPRVGQTVYVAFHDGDPDQPVVLGGYYSAQTPPPYNAASQPTVTALRSQTSPGGGGYNELRFDDAAGAEQFATRAQLDAMHQVNRHSRRDVGGNDAVNVVGSYALNVGGDAARTVGGNSTRTVQGDDGHTIGGDKSTRIAGDHGSAVAGNETRSVGGNLTTTVGGSCSLAVAGDQSLTVGGDASLNVHGDYSITCDGIMTINAKKVLIVGADEVFLYAKSVEGMSEGGAEHKLVGGVASFYGPDHAIVSGSKAAIAGGDKGGSNIVCEQADINASAPVINLNPD